jgi:hypothetical protein
MAGSLYWTERLDFWEQVHDSFTVGQRRFNDSALPTNRSNQARLVGDGPVRTAISLRDISDQPEEGLSKNRSHRRGIATGLFEICYFVR